MFLDAAELAEFGLDELSIYLDAAFDDPSLVSRRMMMQAWAGYLEGIKSGAKIIPILKRAGDRAGIPKRPTELRIPIKTAEMETIRR